MGPRPGHPFLNRRQPETLESLASLLTWIKHANYYDEDNWLVPLLSAPLPDNLNLLQRPEHFTRLSELTILAPETLWGLTLHRFALRYLLPSQLPWEAAVSQPATPPTWDLRRLTLYVHGHPASKVYPCCWRERQATLLPWSLRHVTTCARHQVLLVDHCSQCGSHLQVNWETGVCRICHLRLADLPALSLAGHRASVAVTAVIWTALGCADEVFPPASLNLAPTHLVQQICAPALLEFFWHVGQLLLGRDPHWPLFDSALLLPGTGWVRPPALLRQASVADVHGVLTALWQLLDGWPHTWEMTLERLVELEGPFATDAPQRLPHLLTTQFRAPEFAWLYRGWEDFMWKYRSSKASLYPWLRHWRRTQQAQETHLGGHALLSRREAARHLHVSERAVQRYLASDQVQSPPLPPLPAGEPQRHWRLIEETSVAEVQEQRTAELTLEQAASTCGISKTSARVLATAGVLPWLRRPAREGGSTWAFAPLDLHQALSFLIGHLPLYAGTPAADPADDGLLTLPQALRIVSGAAIALPTLLQAVRVGQVASVRLSSEMTLSALRFERTQLLAWLAAQRPPARTELLTMQEVRDILHCSAATLHRWHRTHLLVPIQERVVATRTRLCYRRQDILDFAERYITAEQAGALLGCSQLTVQSWARAGILPAVSGPEIDGGHRYRFECAVIVRSRQERVSAYEVEQQLGISKSTLHRWVQQGRLVPLPHEEGQHCWFSRDVVHHFTRSNVPRPTKREQESGGPHATARHLQATSRQD